MSNWEPLETPNPREFAVLVWASPQQVLSKMGSLVDGTTTLKEFDLATAPSSEGIGDYVYVKPLGKRADGYMGFVFAKNKTDEQKYTPFKPPKPSFKPFDWDAVVKRITPIAAHGLGRSSVQISATGVETVYSGPEYFAEIEHIPAGAYGTRFLRYDYFAPTEFDIPKHKCPVPTSVVVMLPGREAISFPRALHKRLETPTLITALPSNSVDGDVISAVGGGSVRGQVFPSTEPFETWAAWVIEHDQAEVEAGHHAWKVIAFPPDEPETTVKNF